MHARGKAARGLTGTVPRATLKAQLHASVVPNASCIKVSFTYKGKRGSPWQDQVSTLSAVITAYRPLKHFPIHLCVRVD